MWSCKCYYYYYTNRTRAGVLAYLGFGGYLGLGETLWNQPLNYYLIPVIVSLHASTSCKKFQVLQLTQTIFFGFYSFLYSSRS